MASMDAQWLNKQFQLYPDKDKKDLARFLGVGQSAISKMLSGGRGIKAPEYVQIRRFFGLPVEGDLQIGGAGRAYRVDTMETEHALKEEESISASQWMIPAEIIEPRTKATPDHIKIFHVEDNLMMPDFTRDERVMVDLSDKTPSPPGAFVISDGFGTMIRNCERIPGSDPVRVRISALKDSFAPREVTEKDADILGRVIGKWQWL